MYLSLSVLILSDCLFISDITYGRTLQDSFDMTWATIANMLAIFPIIVSTQELFCFVFLFVCLFDFLFVCAFVIFLGGGGGGGGGGVTIWGGGF